MTGPLRVSHYRDIVEEMTTKLQKSGPIFESALDGALRMYAGSFKLEGDTFVHQETRQPLDEWVVEQRENNAYWYADRPLEGEELEAAQIDDALLNPTLKKLGELYKALGPLRYNKLVADYGTDTVRMKGGTRPEYAADGVTPKPRKAAETNPWSRAGWSLRRQGECIKAMGVGRAAQLAKAAGCVIGSTKPNPDFN